MQILIGMVAFMLGLAAGCGVMDYQHHTTENRGKIIDCQKDLPRSQKCELIAVPKTGDKGEI